MITAQPLPDHLVVGDLTIRRLTVDDADLLSDLIAANREHLRPRMPWIEEEPKPRQERVAGLAAANELWAAGRGVQCGIVRDDRLIGTVGLYDRGWDDGFEVGYWVAADVQNGGVATRAAAAILDLHFAAPEVVAAYLANDVTNDASRRIPEKLGFTHQGKVPVLDPDKVAPADAGVQDTWRITREEWLEARREKPL